MSKETKVVVMKDELVDKIYEARNSHEEYARHNFSAMVRELCEIAIKALEEKK